MWWPVTGKGATVNSNVMNPLTIQWPKMEPEWYLREGALLCQVSARFAWRHSSLVGLPSCSLFRRLAPKEVSVQRMTKTNLKI